MDSVCSGGVLAGRVLEAKRERLLVADWVNEKEKKLIWSCMECNVGI